MKCLNCGKEFTPLTVVQKYCSRSCCDKYRKKHDMNKLYPSITFTCSQCGRTVTTEGGTKDKRTRFCSVQCEKKFWRHPPWDNPSTRINFRSLQEYESWERRTNE